MEQHDQPEPGITLKSYLYRLYYDKNREKILARNKLNAKRKREAAGPRTGKPGRPRLPRPPLDAVLEAVHKAAAMGTSDN